MVVGREFDGEGQQREESKGIIRQLEPSVSDRDDCSIVSGYCQQEKQNILRDGDECEIENLEQPRRNLDAQDLPAVILFFAISIIKLVSEC